MTIDIDTDLQHAVEDAAAHLYVWALKDIPQDLRDALAAARDRETSVPGKRVLEVIHRNVSIADSEKNLVCQDTGIAVYHAQGRRALPAAPRAHLRSAARRHGARDDRAPAALERGAHDHAREHGAEHRLPPADRALGVHRRLGRARRQVRPQGLRLART